VTAVASLKAGCSLGQEAGKVRQKRAAHAEALRAQALLVRLYQPLALCCLEACAGHSARCCTPLLHTATANLHRKAAAALRQEAVCHRP